MTKTWHGMSVDEREQYIDQDHAKRNWREILECEVGSDLFNDLADRSSISIMYTTGPGDEVEIWLKKELTPLQAIYIIQYYFQGMSVPNIAKGVKVQYQVGDVELTKKGVSSGAVYKELQRAKAQLKLKLASTRLKVIG